MTLKRNLVRNGFANLFQKGIKVLEQLFLVPFFITSWGAAYYGEWLTLTIVPSIIAFSDLGFGTAAGNSFVLEYVAGNYQKAANINKTGLYIITITIVFALLFSSGVIILMGYFGVFEKSLIERGDAIMAVSILILARLLNFYSQLFESYFRAARKAALGINLITVKALLNVFGGLAVLLLGYGVIEFALSQLIIIILFNVIFFTIGRRKLKLFKHTRGFSDRSVLRVITRKGLGYLMSPIWQAIYFQGTTFVVRIVLGPEAVAVFNTVRTLSRSVNQLFTMINASVFPELQYEIGAGNTIKAQKLYRVSIISVFIAAICGAGFLAAFGLWFYRFWTHNELNLPSSMWYIFVIGILFNALWWTAAMIFRAKNEPYKFAFAGVVCSIISVISSYFLAQYYGLNGAAIGSVVLEIFMAIYILPLGCKLMGIKVKDIFKNGLDDFSAVLIKFKLK